MQTTIKNFANIWSGVKRSDELCATGSAPRALNVGLACFPEVSEGFRRFPEVSDRARERKPSRMLRIAGPDRKIDKKGEKRLPNEQKTFLFDSQVSKYAIFIDKCVFGHSVSADSIIIAKILRWLWRKPRVFPSPEVFPSLSGLGP